MRSCTAVLPQSSYSTEASNASLTARATIPGVTAVASHRERSTTRTASATTTTRTAIRTVGARRSIESRCTDSTSAAHSAGTAIGSYSTSATAATGLSESARTARTACAADTCAQATFAPVATRTTGRARATAAATPKASSPPAVATATCTPSACCRCGTTVAGMAAIPTSLTAIATVESIAAIATNPTGVATRTRICTYTGVRRIRESIARECPRIGMRGGPVTEQFRTARTKFCFEVLEDSGHTAYAGRPGFVTGVNQMLRCMNCRTHTKLTGCRAHWGGPRSHPHTTSYCERSGNGRRNRNTAPQE